MLQKHIQDLIEPIIYAMGLELWACDLHQHGNTALLRIFIDRNDEQGVTLDDCKLVSRAVGAILDVEDPIKNRYQLEVSSPGMDRALSTMQHFERYVGSNIKIKLRVAINNQKHFNARIEKVVDDKVFLMLESETISVALSDIQRANINIEV